MVKRPQFVWSTTGQGSPAGAATGATTHASVASEGEAAQAVPSADAGRYRRISVRVNAVPNQRVMGSWTVVCHVGGTGTSRGAEDFKGRTPLTVAVRPGALDYGWVCTVVGAATLAGQGR